MKEDVGERQEQQRGRALGVEQVLQLVDGDAQLEHEVAVGEHAALGAPGGAAGVDQRGEGRGRRGGASLLEHLVGDVRAESLQHVDGVVLDRPDVLELRQVAGLPRLAHAGEVVGALGDDRAGAGVGQDPADLLGGGRLVDRHADRAGEPDGVVEEGPLVARLGQQRDPVARLDAGRHEALGDRAHLVVELRRGDVGPPVSAATAEDHRLRCLRGVGDDVVGEVPGGGDGDGERRGELTHGGTSRIGGDVRSAGYIRRAACGAEGRSGPWARLRPWPNRPPRRSRSTPLRPT